MNKKTNEVEQIIKPDYDNFERYNNDTFGDRFYMIEDMYDEVTDYNFLYHHHTQKFIKNTVNRKSFVGEVVVEPNETMKKLLELETENEELKNKIKLILATLGISDI